MKQAINTSTQEEYDSLMRYYESKGIEWDGTGYNPTKVNAWNLHKEETCIISEKTGLTHRRIAYFRKNNISIIPFTEFAKANITPEIDYKALYLEGRELLEEARGHMTAHVPEKIFDKIETFLTKHNTPNRDEEYSCVFLADTKTTSATKCTFCGKEKFEHFNHPTRE